LFNFNLFKVNLTEIEIQLVKWPSKKQEKCEQKGERETLLTLIEIQS